MKWFVVLLSVLFLQMTVYAEEPEDLYAQSAVLMDAESGRVLFEKNGFEQKAMASTTKIMTCILALEYGDLDDVVVFSENAASQPKVHLGAAVGAKFQLRDLLYSLMLESHNDSAVAIAEHIGGSVAGFAEMMNQKAKEIGCVDTHYVTSNGLDASDEGGAHMTTAADLAKVMSYCIKESPKAEQFLYITKTSSHGFQDVESGNQYHCANLNAFLSMMEGAISGKTGYTSKAGYCYVGALERNDRTFVVALLACGWPNHKTYKWDDTKKLMNYGIDHYNYQNVFTIPAIDAVKVENGVNANGTFYEDVYAKLKVDVQEQETLRWLMREDENVEIIIDQERVLEAPVYEGEIVGKVTYSLDDCLAETYNIVVEESIAETDFTWYFTEIVKRYFTI